MTSRAAESEPLTVAAVTEATPRPAGTDVISATPQPGVSATPTTPDDERATVIDSQADSSPGPLGPPRQFGRYEVLEELACGGMGVVYKARDPLLGRVVALKMLRPAGFGQRDESVRRFCREARLIARLKHPHVVPIHEFGEHEGQHYFAMEFVSGGSLDRHVDRYAGDPRSAAVLIAKIARAVHYAHEKGILHRDLKPANVLLDEHGEPLVSDFGLAKQNDGESELTRPGEILGTPAYMAPEQAEGRHDRVSRATDIWALGVLLYTLASGNRPFRGHDRDETLEQIRRADPPRPRPAFDRRLETIALKCLEKDPARRYQSAAALADDLQRWLAGEPITARPESWPARIRRLVRRHPTLSATAGMLLGFATLALFLATGQPKEQPITLTSEDEPSPPQENLRLLQRELAAARPAELIGDKGLPSWYQWRTGKTLLRNPAADREPFALKTWSLSLLELLPDPLCDSYRLRAEVRAESNDLGQVGLYFAHHEHATGQGPEHWFWALTFNENNYVNGVSLNLHHYRERQAATGSLNRTFRALDHRLPAPARGYRWRKLAIEVTPEKTSFFWEDQLLGQATPAELRKHAQEFYEQHDTGQPLPVELSPRGGLGLYGLRTAGSFRRVVIEPLK